MVQKRVPLYSLRSATATAYAPANSIRQIPARPEEYEGNRLIHSNV